VTYLPKTTSKFNRVKKKLPRDLQAAIDEQVRLVCSEPDVGEMKTGDHAGVRVLKFAHMGALYRLAYEVSERERLVYVYAIGGHENFYRDLKRYLKS